MTFSDTLRKLSLSKPKDVLVSVRTRSSVTSTFAEQSPAEESKTSTAPQQLTTRQALMPLILITLIVSACSFSHGITDVLNKRFQGTLGLTKTKSTGLQVAYFSAYLIGPPTYSGYIVRRFGYRWTFITGLCLSALGSILFCPAGRTRSFGFFCGATFIIGSGSATFATSAVPFIATCGPRKCSEIRLNLVLSFQNLCSTGGTLLSSYVTFGDRPAEKPTLESLESVQWIYLGVGIFFILLATILFFTKLPETHNASRIQTSTPTQHHQNQNLKPLHKQPLLIWGITASTCYAGAEIAIHTFLLNYIVEVLHLPDRAAALRLTALKGAFCVSHFVTTLAMRFVKPRHLLLGTSGILVACTTAAVLVRDNAAATYAVLLLSAISTPSIGPTISTIALKELDNHNHSKVSNSSSDGDGVGSSRATNHDNRPPSSPQNQTQTKKGASYLVASVASGIVFAPATGALADKVGTQRALAVPLVGLLGMMSFPLWVNLRKAEVVDGREVSEEDRKEEGGAVV